ncbi:MAG: cysteine desulfurase family protein [Paracoccaceae bacterium]
MTPGPKTRTYLDWNATAPLRPEARDAMCAAMVQFGNPASVHAEGRAARAMIERARADVARDLGCKPAEIVFTSGATEAASVLGRMPGGEAVVVDPTAHDALWAHRRGDAVEGDVPGILAMGLANSETGVLTGLPERRDGRWPVPGGTVDKVLLDVTQAVGRVPFSFAWSGADMAVLSAHKLGGPKGVGALILRDGLEVPALQSGGGQEMGRRSGTENTFGIMGFAAALRASMDDLEAGVWAHVEKLRNILEKSVEAAGSETILVGKDMQRIPNTLCVAVPGWRGETQVMQMDLAGFAISAGSACSSGKVQESRVLRAMGFGPEVAGCAIRVSIGPTTTEEDVLRFAEAWTAQHRKFRARAA